MQWREHSLSFERMMLTDTELSVLGHEDYLVLYVSFLVKGNHNGEIQRGSIIGRWLALIGAGSSLVCSLERYSSTAAAQERPSAMAQTTRL